jgi:hypothetical protein
MNEFAFFAGLTVAVLLLGGAWIITSVLRPAPESDSNADPDNPTVVAAPPNELAAEVIRSKLEALGVPAFTRNRIGRGVFGSMSPTFVGWEVLVRHCDLDEAEEILAEDQEPPS